MRANAVEVALAGLAITAAALALGRTPGLTSALLAGLLLMPVVGWLSAPVHSLAALRVELPSHLSERRDREDRLAWWGPWVRWSLASFAGAVAVAALVYAVVQPASADIPRSGPVTVLPRPSSMPAPPDETAAPDEPTPAPGVPPARATSQSTPAGPSRGSSEALPTSATAPVSGGQPDAQPPGQPSVSPRPTAPGPPATLPGPGRPSRTQGPPAQPPGSPTHPTRTPHTPPGRP